jgi:hypothetical protein
VVGEYLALSGSIFSAENTACAGMGAGRPAEGRDKDDLMDEVVEELLRQTQPVPPESGPWQSRLTAAVDGLRRLLVEEPPALYLYLRHPVVSTSAIRGMEMLLSVLRGRVRHGVVQGRVCRIQTYTIGFAALEASRAGWTPQRATDRTASELAAFTTPTQFASGLQFLLAGIQHEAAAAAPPRTPG